MWIHSSIYHFFTLLVHVMTFTRSCGSTVWCKLHRHGKTGGSGRVRVGSIGSRVKTGHGSKRVIFKQVNRVAGQTGHGLSRVASRVKLTRIFQNFFFFEVDAICQLFMSSLTIIRFSLVILLPITTKHLTWYPNLVQLLFQLSRN